MRILIESASSAASGSPRTREPEQQSSSRLLRSCRQRRRQLQLPCGCAAAPPSPPARLPPCLAVAALLASCRSADISCKVQSDVDCQRRNATYVAGRMSQFRAQQFGMTAYYQQRTHTIVQRLFARAT